YSTADSLSLHTFPTRRSSDLLPQSIQKPGTTARAAGGCAHENRRRADSIHPASPPPCERDAHDHQCGGPILLRLASEGWGLAWRSEEHTSELQSRGQLVCRLL